MKMHRVTKIILLIVLIGPLAIIVFGSVVMLLWNRTLVPVLHVSEVTFWQALGILILAKILFGSFGGGSASNRYYSKQKMMWNQMTPEQKEKFREQWKNRSRRWGFRSQDAEPGSGQGNIEP